MKILFIINSLKSRSGSERVATQLANQLVTLDNYTISIITRDSDQNDSAYPLDKNVDIHKLSGNLICFFYKLKKHIKNNNYDKVVVHNMGKLSLFCSLLPKSIKLISLEHVAYNSRPSSVQWISQFLYKRIDQVITLTQNDKIAFDSFHSNVNVIANFSPFPVATEKKQGSKTIIAIGRLTEQKNYIHLLKAWEKIYEQVLDWKLLIYGDGEHEDLLNNYIKEQNLLNITLNKSTQNITEVYSKANFFVMSSKYEGLPMVLIEAQSFGLPIVSYDCPHGPSDVITNGVNGFLVEDQNIDKLSEAMLTIIESKELQESMSQNSLINAKKYEPKEIINTWVNKVFKVEVN